MAKKDLVMVIDKPHFVVKLHKDLLEVDLKEGAKKKLENFLESKPYLRENLGALFQTIVPIDVPLKDIESAIVDRELYPRVIAEGWAQAKIVIPYRKDIHIPLTLDECEKLVAKLNELIPPEKEKAAKKAEEEKKAEAELEEKRAFVHKDLGDLTPV